jgi:CRISPR-associated endonuclease/helicase Cas3
MNNLPTVLLAKSKRQGRSPVTLEAHLQDADNSAYLIFRLDRRLGQNWCRLFKLHSPELQNRFLLNLRVAALLHDGGKANEDFLSAVQNSGFVTQTMRHEHLSALILCLPEVQKWLGQNPELDVDIITAAVLSHHLKASREDTTTNNGKSYKWGEPQTLKKSVQLYLQHSEITSTLLRIAEVINLLKDSIPQLIQGDWGIDPAWDKAIKSGRDRAEDFMDDLDDDIENGDFDRRQLLVAVKAALIAADAVASGLVREGITISDWINDVVHTDAIDEYEIANKIIYPRLGQIQAKQAKKKFITEEFFAEHNQQQLEQLKEQMLHKFQLKLSFQSSRTLLLAGCGVGKTLAAWIWAEAQSQKYSVSKVIFLYPTRGTALEGFKDYVGWAPEADAALVTGTARYELESMQQNPDEGENSSKVYRSEADERLYALSFWQKRFFSATVDQFLSFMEHSYQSLCLMPALADSVVIIDEVHSFDRSMFDNLVSFLKNFDIPVLCMTATLPQSRRKELEDAGLSVFPTESDRPELEDLKEKEEKERYQIHLADSFSFAYQQAVKAYHQDKKRVLWVVNTVDRCIAIAERLKSEHGIEALTYHSRFTLKDRQHVHGQTIEAFSPKNGSRAIAITTQVCEMSLDLDADVLITEFAPISSLVQRFGRANRHLLRDFADIYIYKPFKEKPYDKEELVIAKKFLDSLGDGLISQHQLAQALAEYSQNERNADGLSRFLTSGYFATPGSFRDADEFTVPCILDRDLEAVKTILSPKSQEKYRKEEYIINVPRKWANLGEGKPSWMPKYLGVAPAERYTSNRGFMTKDPTEVELG